MKIIADLAERYAKLQGLAEDPKVINSDGTKVDPYLELCMELYDCSRQEVTFEMRNHMMKITRHAVEQAAKMDVLRASAAQQAGAYNAYMNTNNPWNRGY